MSYIYSPPKNNRVEKPKFGRLGCFIFVVRGRSQFSREDVFACKAGTAHDLADISVQSS